MRDVWAAFPADVLRICRESRRTAFWKIKNPARRAYKKMFLCGDLEQRVRGGLAPLLRFVKLASHGEEGVLTFALCVVLLGAAFLFFLQRFSLFCDSDKQVSTTLGVK